MAKGQKKTSTRKFYPGYVLVKLVLSDHTWHFVQSIPRVTGFVGSKVQSDALSESEAKKILDTIEDRKEQPRPKFHFERGDEVRVIDGPFSNFNGMVEDVNYDKGKLRVSVSIFGRQTPVELDFVQVTKS
jgi:transcription termination/antitermination protein NusG